MQSKKREMSLPIRIIDSLRHKVTDAKAKEMLESAKKYLCEQINRQPQGRGPLNQVKEKEDGDNF